MLGKLHKDFDEFLKGLKDNNHLLPPKVEDWEKHNYELALAKLKRLVTPANPVYVITFKQVSKGDWVRLFAVDCEMNNTIQDLGLAFATVFKLKYNKDTKQVLVWDVYDLIHGDEILTILYPDFEYGKYPRPQLLLWDI